MALFGRSKTDARKTAKSEYDKACTLRGEDRKEQAYQMKVALRCRAHIDELFIEGAEGAENGRQSLAKFVALQGPVSEHAENGELEDICPACHGYPFTST